MAKDTKKIQMEDITKLKTYLDRYNFNVKEYGLVEQKGKFDYVSWSNCELIGNLLDPEFSWEIKTEDGVLADTPRGFVKVEMTFLGKTRNLLHPVLDFNNKPIANPNAFETNKANMRAMSKLFSISSGIGLSLYTGEDLPEETKETKTQIPQQQVHTQDIKPKVDTKFEDHYKISEAQLKLVNVLISKTGTDREAVKANYKVTTLKDLTIPQTQQLIEVLQKRQQDQEPQMTLSGGGE